MACSSTGYTGQNYCNKNSRFGKPTGIIFANSAHTNSAADFLLEASWVGDVETQLVFPLHNMKDFEDLSTEPTYHDYPDGSRKLTDQGDYRFAASFDLNECVKKQLLNFRGFQDGIYLVYGDVIRGRTVDSGTNVVPIRVLDTNIEKAKLPTMDSPEMVRVVVELESHKDLNEYDYSREMSWDVSDLDGLTEVTLTLVSATAIAIVVDVSADCGGDSKPISGLGVTKDDWTLTLAGGTFTSVSESATVPGRYTFVTVGAANNDTLDLVSPATRGDNVLAISSGALTITGIA